MNSAHRRGSSNWCTVGQTQFVIEKERPLGRHRMRAYWVLQHKVFDFAIGCVILINCITIGIELSWPDQENPPTEIAAFEHVFLVIYIGELALRFFVMHLACLEDNWVRFDLFLVFSGVLEQWVMKVVFKLMDGGLDSSNLEILMVLRIMRLFRLARTVRLVIKFREMWILVRGILDSGGMMVYTFLLLVVMLFVFGCAGREIVGKGSLSNSAEVEPHIQELLERYFSSVPITMLTLVQFVCLDSIGAIYEPLIKADSNPLLALYFLVTILVIGIVLMNLITAVIVNTAIEKAMEDKAIIAQTKAKKRKKLVKELREMFMPWTMTDPGR